MKETKITGRIQFCDKELQEFNRTFTATLTESGAFAYGNRTAVVIEWEKQGEWIIDTRYDVTIKRDGSNFKEWIKSYFKERFETHKIEID